MSTKNQKPITNNLKLTIGWLYPQLMNTYGDTGNIIVLQKRSEWREITVEVKHLNVGFTTADLKTCDLLFMGGAQDKQQTIVSEDLKQKKSALKSMIEEGIPGLYICGAYQFLGKYYKEADGTVINGLDIFDLYTENPGENHPRLIGNILIKHQLPLRLNSGQAIINYQLSSFVGFENHGGRTYLGNKMKPLGTVEVGFGNNGNQPRVDGGQAGDQTEGAVYKNSFGSYLHGPILPKNPHFADHLIQLALEKKYQKEINLKSLDDELEIRAHEVIAQRIRKQI